MSLLVWFLDFVTFSLICYKICQRVLPVSLWSLNSYINLRYLCLSSLVSVGVDPKSVLCAFYKQGQCTKGDKCKFSHDLSVERKCEKRSLYVDERDDELEKGQCILEMPRMFYQYVVCEQWNQEHKLINIAVKRGITGKQRINCSSMSFFITILLPCCPSAVKPFNLKQKET